MTDRLGRYEIQEEIGRGGFAIVYRAYDTDLDRLVALKELKPVLLQDNEWVRRFRREARAIARLDHPGIVPIYDVGEIDSRLFLVMRLVTGPSLEELIAEQGRLSWSEVVAIIKTVAEGLDYAHNQGILHRDLKPGNILIDPERGPMLTDFGLAKLAGENSTSLTANRSVIGTPHYIAPEAWEGQGASVQTDIYALGCVVYEMLTGKKAFRGKTSPAVMMAHFRPVKLPQKWPEGTPAGVAEPLMKALANQPDERYSSAGELAEALAQLSKNSLAGPGQQDTYVEPPTGLEQAVRPTPDAPNNRIQSDDQNSPKQETPSASWEPEGVSPIDSERLNAAKVNLGDSFNTPDIDDLTPDHADDYDSGRWRGFLTHLGPYVIIIGALAMINFLTDPGGYPWFLWPAMGWGVGLAFHLYHVVLEEMKGMTGKWHDFLNHFGAYAIIMGLLISIYLMTNPGGYPWFLWPAMGWGAAVAIHLCTTLVSKEKGWQRSARHQARAKRRGRRQEQKAEQHQETETHQGLQVYLERAQTYKAQIEALIQSSSDRNVHVRLRELVNQIDEWMEAIEALTGRIERFRQDAIIQHDLRMVPESITKLKDQLAAEADAATRTELERTLNNRRNQLAALNHLQNMMRRAEIKIESTLSALGTIYSQILIGQSTNHVADYGRLSREINEEVHTLQDQLDALEEVKLGHIGNTGQ